MPVGGGDGWAVLMALDASRVAALCRRLKNGVLTQQEINELCGPRRPAQPVPGQQAPGSRIT
jgi:hypothetical protein